MTAEHLDVDVILPTYNGVEWMGEAIESVLRQSYPHWRMVIVDDASSDDTVQLARSLCEQHPEKLSLITHTDNRRAAARRMEAIAGCSAPLIAFLDQDDRWMPDKLARQVERVQAQPTVHAVHTDVTHMDPFGRPLPSTAEGENAERATVGYDTLDPRTVCRKLFQRNTIRLVSAMVKRDAFLDVGGFNDTLFGGEDWEFWVRFSSRKRIGHIPKPLVERRIHPTNTSMRYRLQRTYGLLEALRLVEEGHPFLEDLARIRRSELLGRLVIAALDERDFPAARRGAWQLLGHEALTRHSIVHAGLAGLGPAGRGAVRSVRQLRKIARG
ncbi:MAG: glycosyltransferase [Myxococcales bacterium]|nr:glycosyltransferase [Myxococcales bacterium]